MIKALHSRSNKKAIISNLDGYESEIIDNMVRLIKVNTKCNNDHGIWYKAEYENGSGIKFKYSDVYLNEWDQLKTVEFKYQATNKYKTINLHRFTDSDIKIISQSIISYKLSMSNDYAYLYRCVEFDIKVKAKYTVKIIAKILMDKIAKPNEFTNLAIEIRNINRVDPHAFIHSEFTIEDDSISTNVDDITLSTRYISTGLIVNMKSALSQYYKKLGK